MAKKPGFKKEKSAAKNNQLCAILSYLLIGIIWYFVDKDMQKDEFVKFHVKQSIILLIAAIAWSIIISILFNILSFGFFFGIWWILRLLSYVPLVWTIIGIINALNRKKNELPIIGKYAAKLSF